MTDNESETNRLSSERSTLEDPLNLVQKCVNLILLTLMVILDRYRIYYYCYYYIISSSFVLCQSFSKGPNSYSSSFLHFFSFTQYSFPFLPFHPVPSLSFEDHLIRRKPFCANFCDELNENLCCVSTKDFNVRWIRSHSTFLLHSHRSSMNRKVQHWEIIL